MIKDELIERFKDACSNPTFNYMAAYAVKQQFNRTNWQIEDFEGIFRISFNDGEPIIRLFPFVGSDDYVYAIGGKIEYELSLMEYLELEGAYIGDAKPDYEYMARTYGQYIDKDYMLKNFGVQWKEIMVKNMDDKRWESFMKMVLDIPYFAKIFKRYQKKQRKKK